MISSSESPKTGQITRLLKKVSEGDADAFDRLLPLVYDTLREISRQQLRRRRDATLATTELVHEAYVKMARQEPVDWKERGHFFAVAARAMRQILIDHARRRSAEKRGGDRDRITFTDRHARFRVPMDKLLAVDEALERLEGLSERLGRVVELRFFGGMTGQEIAEVLGVSTRTVERDWVKARLFLHRELHPERSDQ